GTQGAPAGRPEYRGRSQEPPDRGSPPQPAREGRAAVADLALQVRISGQYVTRAQVAPEQPAPAGGAAALEPRAQPERQADRDGEGDVFVGPRPAERDQRHPRPVEDRGRQRRARPHRRRAGRAGGRPGEKHALPVRGQGAGVPDRLRARPAAGAAHRRPARQAVADQPVVQRPEVHLEGRRDAGRAHRRQRLDARPA
ncbi:hypothetical protein LTR94_031329, partial [Friedmanniomyces endolithicus]